MKSTNRCWLPVFASPIPAVLFMIVGLLFPARVIPAQEGIFELAGGRAVTAEDKYDWCASFFQDAAPLTMELEADFEGLSQLPAPDAYLPGVLVIYLDAGEFARVNVRIQPRGYSRLKACAFPPLKVDFSHGGTSLEPVRALGQLKMVTLCREGAVQEEYLLTEYLVYRLYQTLTDVSLGVRRGQIRNVMNTADRKVMYEGPAFFIEDIDKMAHRMGGREYQKEEPTLERLDSIQTGMMTVFQFMIGNLDWSVGRYHNVKLIEVGKKGEGRLLPVPYDFDLSRLVDALYSSTPPDPNVPQPPAGRIYRGPCFSAAQLEAILGRYREKEAAVFELVDSLRPLLSPEKGEEIRSSLESFYRLIRNPQEVEMYFIRYCQD